MTAGRGATSRVRSVARAGLWLLPVYGLLLTLSTLTHQPDPATEFEEYARYVSTDVFLASHLVGSILGAGLGLAGIVSALYFLLSGPAAVSALVGVALTAVANVLLTAVFAAAAFAQPAIGRAFLAGDEGMRAFNDDVYGPPLLLTAGVGLLLFVAAAAVFGRAVARTSSRLRWSGIGYGAGLGVFAVAALTFEVAQPVAAAVTTVSAVVISLRLPDA